MDFEKGDYINIPRAVTYRVLPRSRDNFFLIVQSKTEFNQPEKRSAGPACALRSGDHQNSRPAPMPDDGRAEWKCASSG